MWETIVLTIKLATITTFLLLLIGTPLAWWLVRPKRWWKEIFASIISLPLVLPPTVLGFYLLLVLSPNNDFGAFLAKLFGHALPFTLRD
jgi:molybdate transport system permease protein